MSRTDRKADHISDAELRAAAADLDQLHRDQTLPAMESAVEEWVSSLREGPEPSEGASRPSRRAFLLGGAGVVGGSLLLAACSSSSKKASTATTTPATTSPSSTELTGDLAVAAMAASLENLAVFAYNAAIMAAKAGKLGTVPPAVVTFAVTAMGQHKDHASAWNSVLEAAGKPAVTATDPVLTPTVQQKFSKITDVTGVAELALLLENVAAQTYQNGVAVLSGSKAISIAATIQPVEMQHAAILYYVLGRYPGIQGTASNDYASGTPLAFNPTTLARPPSDYKGS